MNLPRTVIIGAGFAGLSVAKSLKNAATDILLIDQHNYHTFQPLLYQVATAELEPSQIAHNARAIFHRQRNIDFLQGQVTSIDNEAKEVILASGRRESYDYVVVAAGAITHDFGVAGVREHAFFLKSLSEASNLRSHILHLFEKASQQPSLIDEGILNFVVAGGGPTGVEMAGALLELCQRTLPKDYPKLPIKKARVILLEQAPQLLGVYRERTQSYTLNNLLKRGVDVRTDTAVTSVDADEVTLSTGEVIPSHCLIWTAGVKAHPLSKALDAPLTRGQRVVVTPHLNLPERRQVFVIGDISGAEDAEGKLYPQVSPVAIQQGQHVARQIICDLEGKPRQPFRYFNKGSMAIVGRGSGIAELSPALGGLAFRGGLGWLAWLFLHLMYLVGYKNRAMVLLSWLHSGMTRDKHNRLIVRSEPSELERTNRLA